MGFGQEMKDFIGGFEVGTKFWDDVDRNYNERLKQQAAYEKARGPTEGEISGQQGFTYGSNKVGDVDVSGMDKNEIYNGFMGSVQKEIQNPYALAAIASTGTRESGFSPGNSFREWNDGKNNAGGIMSWNGPRLAALKKANGGTYGSPEQQAAFFLSENPELVASLKNAKSVQEAQSLMNNAWGFKGYDDPNNAETQARFKTAEEFLPRFQSQTELASNVQGPTAPKTGAIPAPAGTDATQTASTTTDSADDGDDTEPDEDSDDTGVESEAPAGGQASLAAPVIPSAAQPASSGPAAFAATSKASGFSKPQQMASATESQPVPKVNAIGQTGIARAMLSPEEEARRRAIAEGSMFAATGGVIPPAPGYQMRRGGRVPDQEDDFPAYLEQDYDPASQMTPAGRAASDSAALQRRQALANDRAPRDDAFEPPIPMTRSQQVSRETRAPGRMAGEGRYRPIPKDRKSKDDNEPMAPKGRRPQTGRAPGRMAGEDRYIPDEADRELPTYNRPVQGPPSPPRAPVIPPRDSRRDTSAEPARRADEAAAERRRNPELEVRRRLQEITGGPRNPPGAEAATPVAPQRSPSPHDPTLGQQVRDVTAGPRNPPSAPVQGPPAPPPQAPTGSPSPWDPTLGQQVRDATTGPRNPPAAPAAPQQGPDVSSMQPTAPEMRRRDGAIPGRLAGEDRYQPNGQVTLVEAIKRGVTDALAGVKEAYTSPQPSEEPTGIDTMGNYGRGGSTEPPAPAGAPAESAAAAEPTPSPDVPGRLVGEDREAYPVPTGAIPIPGERPARPAAAPAKPVSKPVKQATRTVGAPTRQNAPVGAPPARRGEPQPEWGQRSTPSPTAMRGEKPPTVGQWLSGRRSQGVARQATHGGLRFLQDFFGLGQQGAIDDPRQQAGRQAGQQRFAQGEGAATREEVAAMDEKIGLDPSLDTGDKMIQRYSKIYQWYMQRGRPKDAAAAAAGLMQYGAQQFGQIGSLAGAAYRDYQQTGNPEALQKMTMYLNEAYKYVPDGANFEIEIDPRSHQIIATKMDGDGNVDQQFPVRPEELPQILRSVMDRSAYWQAIAQTADPAGARAAANRRATDERAAANRKATDARSARTQDRQDARSAATNTRLAEKEKTRKEEAAAKQIDWGKSKPLLDAAVAAKAELDADEENPDLKKKYDIAASRAMDSLPPNLVTKTFLDLDLEPDSFTYVRPEAGGTAVADAAPAAPAAPPARPPGLPAGAEWDAQKQVWKAINPATGKMSVLTQKK